MAAVVIVAALMLSGCSRSGSPAERACPPELIPTYLPEEAERIDLDPYIPGDARTVWRVDQGFLEVTVGADDRTEFVDVDNTMIDDEAVPVGYVADEDDPATAPTVLHWRRKTSCGPTHVAVSSNVIPQAELERVAGSLREGE